MRQSAQGQSLRSVLTRGRRIPRLAPAFAQLFDCPVSGPPVLAGMWRRTDLSASEYSRLLYHAYLLPDRRISDTLVTVVRRASNTSAHRQFALGAVIRMLEQSEPFDLNDLRSNGRTGGHASTITEGSPRPGAVPINEAARRRIFQLFADMAAQGTDSALTEIAYAGVSLGMSPRFPGAAILPANAVVLTYMCGNRFRVRNRTPRTLVLEWDVYGTAAKGWGIYPPAAPGASPPERFFTTPVRGTVRLSRGSQLLQTKANGGTKCP